MVLITAIIGFTDNSGSSFQYPINTIDSGIAICSGTTEEASFSDTLPSLVQSNITQVGNISSGTWNATVISPTRGGTGLNNYSAGDIIYASATNVLSKLSIGSNGKFLSISSGIPSWASLATVASSGNYNDLTNKPTIPSAQIQSDWTQTNSGSVDFIKNKPVLSFSTPTFSSATSATQLSSSRNCNVIYTFPTNMTSLIASQSLTATLQYADDSGFTTNVVTVNSDVQGCSGILSLTLTGRLQVQGIIPAGKYRKVTLSQSGGATVPTTLSSGQEVLL